MALAAPFDCESRRDLGRHRLSLVDQRRARIRVALGDRWRDHEDVDFGICRYQLDRAVAWFDGWDVHTAHEGELTPWGSPQRVVSPNKVWLRRDPAAPWVLDLTVGDGTDTEWVYRRDIEVRRPWREAVLRSDAGVPYLAPELQLLFKSKNPRNKDWVDARRVIPHLDQAQRAFLSSGRDDDHPWQALV